MNAFKTIVRALAKRRRQTSPVRKQYFARLVARCLIFVACLTVTCTRPQALTILDGMNFFTRFSPFHLLWAVWVFDMVLQIVPTKNNVALGSQKLFANRFRPIRDKLHYQALKDRVLATTASAYKVFALWTAVLAVIGALYFLGALSKSALFMIAVFFYVCDLICVLIWCPFRLIMKNKCCTTCRIFNWDHLMMFSPLIFAGGFFCLSLAAMAVIAWLIWEVCVLVYPERFCEKTNLALTCAECTDKLCTQYCQKLR